MLIAPLAFVCPSNAGSEELPARRAESAKGTPIVHMWDCPMPDPGKPGAGFPILHSAKHVRLYKATRETGGYSHHSRLVRHNDTFYAMWSNHPHGEDAAGQRVLFATSADGAQWSPWRELFPPPGPVKAWEETGAAFTAGGWAVVEGQLYARAGCHSNVGFENADRTSLSPRHNREHRFRKRAGRCAFAREVGAEGPLGPILLLGRRLPAEAEITCSHQVADDESGRQLMSALSRAFYRHPRHPPGVDTTRLCEATWYTARDDKHVCLLRDDAYSHRMYVSVSEDGVTWPAAQPTDIPDSPSLSFALTLQDGTVLLIGNHMAPAFDNPEEKRHYQRDPLTICVSPDGYRFTRVYALRTGVHQFRVDGVRGRGGGAQYPSALVHDGVLYVQYSMGKEDVWVSSVSLAELGLDKGD